MVKAGQGHVGKLSVLIDVLYCVKGDLDGSVRCNGQWACFSEVASLYVV